MTISYIAKGKLFLQTGDGPEIEIESHFSRQIQKRLQSIEDRKELFRGTDELLTGGLPMADRGSLQESFTSEVSCVGSDPGTGGLYYAIDTENVRGLFAYDPEERYERRLFHGPSLRFNAISVRQEKDGELWLVAAAQDNGISRIGVFLPEQGDGIREVTEGDSVDAYPTWFPGERRRFAYQTSGIAHSSTGEWLGLGPASIQSVDLETGEMEPLAEDGHTDYLCPEIGSDGSLYYLRRPYQPFRSASTLDVFKDLLFFPFRLLRAIVAFLNVFSMIFTGKPIQTAGGGPKRKGPDPKAVFLYGRWVNVEQEMSRRSLEEEIDSAVPRNWELVHRPSAGADEVLARGVMAYTLCGDGGDLVYSNGRGVFRLASNGRAEKLSDRKMVTCLCALATRGSRAAG